MTKANSFFILRFTIVSMALIYGIFSLESQNNLRLCDYSFLKLQFTFILKN